MRLPRRSPLRACTAFIALGLLSIAGCSREPLPTPAATPAPSAVASVGVVPPSDSAPPTAEPSAAPPEPSRPPHAIHGVAWSPSGRRAATWCSERCATSTVGAEQESSPCPVYLWDLGGSQLLNHVDVPCSHGRVHIEWSADDQLVASSDYDSLQIRRVDAAKPFTETGAIAMYGGFEFSPDGKVLVWGNVFGSVQVLDSATGRVLRNAQLHPGAASLGWFAHWDPTGRLIAVGLQDGGLELWDGRSGAHLRNVNVPGLSDNIDVHWTRDGKRLAFVAGDGLVAVTDLTSGKTRLLQRASRPEGAGGPVPSFADLSSDETKLAVLDGFGRLSIWDLAAGTRRELLPPREVMGWNGSVRFAPGGRHLFVQRGEDRAVLLPLDDPGHALPIETDTDPGEGRASLLGWGLDGTLYWQREGALFGTAPDGKRVFQRALSGPEVEAAMSRDKRFLAIADGALEVLRLSDRASLRFTTREQDGKPMAAAPAPDEAKALFADPPRR